MGKEPAARDGAEIETLLRMLAALASGDELQVLVRLLGERASQADRGKACEEWLRSFGRSKQRARVYLALDGHRSVRDVAAHLGMKPQNVTRELSALKEMGLVEIAESRGNEMRYRKRFFDPVVGLSSTLAERFDLDPTGLARERPAAARR
jgi:DNA-binding transcriptional ArsR family regulator